MFDIKTCKKFNDRLKKALDSYIEKLEVDVEELDSYHYVRNPYGVEEQLIGTSSCYDWDEDEEYEAQVAKMLEYIETDGVENYLDLEPEDWDNEDEGDATTLNKEVKEYLESLQQKGKFDDCKEGSLQAGD